MSLPELLCPRCGRGRVSGKVWPSCADFPPGEAHHKAHELLCSSFAVHLCDACEEEVGDDLPTR